MKKPIPRIAATAMVILAACGGNVIVDGASVTPSGSGGVGGSGGTPFQVGVGGGPIQVGGTGGVPGGGGAGGSCPRLPRLSASEICSGATTSGSGVVSCGILYCDQQGSLWEAACQGGTCACSRDESVICTCALPAASDVCSGASDCCFHG